MSMDINNEVFNELADKIENVGAHIGNGIAWAGFWIGLGLATKLVF